MKPNATPHAIERAMSAFVDIRCSGFRGGVAFVPIHPPADVRRVFVERFGEAQLERLAFYWGQWLRIAHGAGTAW